MKERGHHQQTPTDGPASGFLLSALPQPERHIGSMPIIMATAVMSTCPQPGSPRPRQGRRRGRRDRVSLVVAKVDQHECCFARRHERRCSTMIAPSGPAPFIVVCVNVQQSNAMPASAPGNACRMMKRVHHVGVTTIRK